MEEDQFKGLKKAFDCVDLDHDGKITVADIKKAAELAKFELSDAAINKWIKAFDDSADEVTLEKFKQADTKNLNGLAFFLYFDANHDGTVTKEEFLAGGKTIIEDGQDLEAMFSQVDTDNDGKISCADFVNIYVKMSPENEY